MRATARTDRNHSEIVAALRAVGCSVQSLAAVGKGVPDLLVGFRGKTLLIEVKDGAKAPSRRRLTPDQVMWSQLWEGGKVHTVTSVDEAITAVSLS